MNGLLGNLRRSMPATETLTAARDSIEAIPAMLDAVGQLQNKLRDLPPAGVILGAASRLLSDAICKELTVRGPSLSFTATCVAAGLDEMVAAELHRNLVEEIGR